MVSDLVGLSCLSFAMCWIFVTVVLKRGFLGGMAQEDWVETRGRELHTVSVAHVF